MLKHSALSAMGHRRILLVLVMGLAVWLAEGMLHFFFFDKQGVHQETGTEALCCRPQQAGFKNT